ncbi:MAG: MBL fold metallo-hydrolase [Clostridiales bacterium]|jgi:L-ascorbate metabolism protein UlaG (beta-lactamase superfamily)|nr:MBL fold metallo-hydrolase [Clostridiales bacterium]
MEKTTVTYLGHSGWIVETHKSYFIFDYDKPPGENSALDLTKLHGKPAYFFSSHKHGDHYNKTLNQAVSRFANMKFITGGFHAPFEGNIAMRPRQTLSVGDLSVTTAASTDLGVCFLVQSRGLTIFHSGDNANWPDNEATPVDYFDEIDFIASKTDIVDLAFIPVNTGDWYQDPCLLEGAVYAVKKLNPAVVFPMHANGREDFYKSFAEYAAGNGAANSIICMEKPGDLWSCVE